MTKLKNSETFNRYFSNGGIQLVKIYKNMFNLTVN